MAHGQGTITWKGKELRFVSAKVTVSAQVSPGGGLPGQHRLDVTVDAYFQADRVDAKAGGINKESRDMLMKCAIDPSRENQKELLITFTEAQDKEKVCQYRLDWAWISEFRDYQPHTDDQKLDGNSYNQLIFVRWTSIAKENKHIVAVS